MSQPDHLTQAMAYATRGWPAFPLKPGEKTPATAHGVKDATTNENLITRWWDRSPEANIGIATGQAAGCWVLDVDGETGSRSLTALENELGPLPETLEQRTGGGGRQLFFRWRDTREVRNKQNLQHDALPKKSGLDVRGEGGYIVAPPSLHPSGQRYDWPYGDNTPIADAPLAWLDLIAPKAKRLMPWERQPEPTVPTSPPPKTPVTERARLYLAECDPAVQGSGGHNALLWAARAMVVGFELSDADALSLLWSEFNPRCSPPWNFNSQKDRKDFERKVAEARRTPGEKPAGWLLDEYGLRTDDEALLEMGRRSQEALLANASKQDEPEPTASHPAADRKPFPLYLLPGTLAMFADQVAEAHDVDDSFVGLPMLVAAGSAIGNAMRIQLKRGFTVPPTLWGALVGASGTNKSGPLEEVVGPLRDPIPSSAVKNPLLTPVGRTVVSDTTLEAVVSLLHENPRGLLLFRDELAGWANTFNAYKKGGGDEQAWLEFWGGKTYVLDRKTNNERVTIPAASCCVLGGIQPKVLADCFDPGKMASGLVPRFLVACPPARNIRWTYAEVDPEACHGWRQAIQWLRVLPFASFDPNQSWYSPHVVKPARDAMEYFILFYNRVSHQVDIAPDEAAKALASKARVMAARLALVHHGLLLATLGIDDLSTPVELDSMVAGCEWAQWFLDEQLRVFGFAKQQYADEQVAYLYQRIVDKSGRKRATVRQVLRWCKRYADKQAAVDAMSRLVEAERARWANETKDEVILI